MHPLIYTATYAFPILTIASLWMGGWALILMPLITFVCIPIIEVLWSGSTFNFDDHELKSRQKEVVFDWLIYAIVPLQLAVVGTLIYLCSVGHYSVLEFFMAVFSAGLCCGAFGINVAHEFGHRKNKFDQLCAKILLLTSLYMHFFIEHNRGHHARVATEDDPASSWRGQHLYQFWLRSVSQGYLSAWELENKRLIRRFDTPWLTLENEMLRYQLIQGLTVGLIAGFFGWVAALAFVLAACVGFLLLETVNYVEHYGLRRSKKTNGRFERVMPWHSWNSNHTIGRVLLFELTRHSDHHANPGRKYPTLRHFDESPQLPTGYPGMIVLALFPPLWFAVMNPHLDRELQRLEAQVA